MKAALTDTRPARFREDMDEDAIFGELHRNPALFEILYQRYVTRLYRYLYARVGCAAEAEDLTSQVFIAALEGLPRYRHRGNFAAWLFSLARRKVADYYRAPEKRRRAETLDENLAAALADPLTGLIRQEDLRELAYEVAHLPADGQELLRLRFAAGLGFEQIAAVLGRKPSAVKMAFYRLIERLSQIMEVNDD